MKSLLNNKPKQYLQFSFPKHQLCFQKENILSTLENHVMGKHSNSNKFPNQLLKNIESHPQWNQVGQGWHYATEGDDLGFDLAFLFKDSHGYNPCDYKGYKCNDGHLVDDACIAPEKEAENGNN